MVFDFHLIVGKYFHVTYILFFSLDSVLCTPKWGRLLLSHINEQNGLHSSVFGLNAMMFLCDEKRHCSFHCNNLIETSRKSYWKALTSSP